MNSLKSRLGYHHWAGLALAAALAFFPAAAQAEQGPTAYSIFHPGQQPVSGTPSDATVDKVYSQPSRAPDIAPEDVLNPAYFDAQGETPVGHKIDAMQTELNDLHVKVGRFAGIVSNIESSGQNRAAAYYASVATIETQLQSGTTPGNPRLLQKYQTARQALDQMGGNAQTLNDVSLQLTSLSTHAGYLMDTIKATYGLSGAVEEDHIRLEKTEDATNSTSALINRLLDNVNDAITRTNAYINGERSNMRILAAAIESGSMLGRSLSSHEFKPAPSPDMALDTGISGKAPASGGALPGGPRPLVNIRFDRSDVHYQQPLYMAVNDALKRYPDARFAIVAIHPSRGNAAQIAIETTKARRDGETVLRSLTQMGLQPDRIDLSAAPSADATSSEVRVYVR